MGSQHMQPDLSTSQTLHTWYKITKMNKYILMLGLAVTLLCLASLPSVEADGLLNRICEKCNYCKTDPNCDGCQRCGECSSRSQRGCRFCKKVKMRLVAEKDAPKGVAFVVARMEKVSRVARIIKLGVKHRKKIVLK